MDKQEQSSNKYIITFKLYDGKSIVTLEFEKNTTIKEIFRIIQEEFDLQKYHYKSFKTPIFEHEWVVQSQATKQMIGYEDQTIEEILKEIQVDTFIFQQQGTQGIRIQNWFPQYSHTQSLPQLDESQIELVKLNKIEANVSFSENDYQQSIEYFMNVLDIDPTDREAIIGLGKCLLQMEFPECDHLFNILLNKDPNDNEAEYYKACSLNKQNKYQQAYEIFKKFENTRFGEQSYVNEEIMFSQIKNGVVQQKPRIDTEQFSDWEKFINQISGEGGQIKDSNLEFEGNSQKVRKRKIIEDSSDEQQNEEEIDLAKIEEKQQNKIVQQNEEKQPTEEKQINKENNLESISQEKEQNDKNQSDEEVEKITKKQCI